MIAPQDVSTIVAIGNGLMGQGISQVFARAGEGVYDWSKRDGKALLAARADRLFRHMAEDRAES